jgi:DNA-binding transcriptional regulator YiaG
MIIKIGEKIKELRKKADVTQERFAEYLGITAQAVSKWEVESGYPDIE